MGHNLDVRVPPPARPELAVDCWSSTRLRNAFFVDVRIWCAMLQSEPLFLIHCHCKKLPQSAQRVTVISYTRPSLEGTLCTTVSPLNRSVLHRATPQSLGCWSGIHAGGGLRRGVLLRHVPPQFQPLCVLSHLHAFQNRRLQFPVAFVNGSKLLWISWFTVHWPALQQRRENPQPSL